MSINSTRKRLGWQHSSVKIHRTRWLSTPIGIKFCIRHKTQRGRSWPRDKSLVTSRAIRREKKWKSHIVWEGSSGEEVWRLKRSKGCSTFLGTGGFSPGQQG